MFRNAQAHFRHFHWLKPIDLLVADHRARRQRFPYATRLALDDVLAHPFTGPDVFHGYHVVDHGGFAEHQLKLRAGPIGTGSPHTEAARDLSTEFGSPLGVGFGN